MRLAGARCIGFQPHHSAKARSLGARVEECPTLSTDFHIAVAVGDGMGGGGMPAPRWIRKRRTQTVKEGASE